MKHKIKFQVPQLERAFDMGDPSGQDLVFLQVVKEGLHHYEPPLPMLVVSYLSRYQGTFIDVGANTGLYSLIAAAVSEDVNVVAFEPLPQIYAKLVENIRLNEAFARRTRTSPVALSRRTGTRRLFGLRSWAQVSSCAASFALRRGCCHPTRTGQEPVLSGRRPAHLLGGEACRVCAENTTGAATYRGWGWRYPVLCRILA
jgi:hypothetical protein